MQGTLCANCGISEEDSGDDVIHCGQCGKYYCPLCFTLRVRGLKVCARCEVADGNGDDWSVMLLYPDYIADNYGIETYLTNVHAFTATEAVRKARCELLAELDENDRLDLEGVEPLDFVPLLVCRGWCVDESGSIDEEAPDRPGGDKIGVLPHPVDHGPLFADYSPT